MKNSKEESAILETLHPDFGQLRLTKTMLEKSIIDANVSIRRFAKLFQVDFETMKAGERGIGLVDSSRCELVTRYLIRRSSDGARETRGAVAARPMRPVYSC